MYNTILLVRSFRKQDRKRLGYGALAASLLITFSFFTVFNPYLGSLPLFFKKLVFLRENNSKELMLISLNSTNTRDNNNINFLKIRINFGNYRQKHRILPRTHHHAFHYNDLVGSKCVHVYKPAVLIIKKKLNLRLSTGEDEKLHLFDDTDSSLQIAKGNAGTKNSTVEPPLCTFMGRSDFCEIKGDIRIDGNSYTVFIVSSEIDMLAAENTSWCIRPYARKGDQAAMDAVREWTVKLVAGASHILPQCTQNHSVPAILFSAGGYSGNHFHSFADIIVPLFLTSRPYNGDVQFLITNALSRYQPISIDYRQDIHCYDSMTVGLIRRTSKELSIDPSNSPYSMKDFRKFLRSSYSLKRTTAIKIGNVSRKRPRLVIISRKRSRAFTNVGEIVSMAKRLGFRVVVAEPDADVSGFAKIINSCDVMMGVHGAGLTNMVFLPEKAVLVQVIPIGGTEWLSKTYFEEPAKDMNIRYLDYKIRVEESSLIHQYPADHVVLRDPSALSKQNVTLDVNRFRPTLVKALELLHQ
ncbi:beta-1,2-xylosyltransferase [Salix suchowensis]|nr:beta-1,2-xylosyltransferase [Salix suchowensis]